MADTNMNQLNFPYLPATDEDRKEMLAEIGIRTFEELISHIPKEVRAKALELKDGLSELELTQHLKALSDKNKPASAQLSFLGGGSYRRFVPAAVPSIISRSEFATAYTPYQPEVSQGSLQAIYEFQSAICLITGMDVANASMYDGPTAVGEAAYMATRLTNRKKIVLSETIGPDYRLVTKTYARSCGLPYETLKAKGGVTDLAALQKAVDQDTACFIVQYTNYFGCLEDLAEIEKVVHAAGALMVVITDPISLGILKAPGDLGADIVVGDAQSCGNSLSFGGPSAGYMACRKDYVRQLPGRLAGMTVDNRGQRAFTLTLQTREQHIRRAKATSNICTNQALNALAMLVYLTCMGPKGLSELCQISVQRAHYLAEKLTALDGLKLTFDQPFFNEFALTYTGSVDELLEALKERNILGGISVVRHFPDMKNTFIVAVTEMNSKEELDSYVSACTEILAGKSASTAKRKALTV